MSFFSEYSPRMWSCGDRAEMGRSWPSGPSIGGQTADRSVVLRLQGSLELFYLVCNAARRHFSLALFPRRPFLQLHCGGFPKTAFLPTPTPGKVLVILSPVSGHAKAPVFIPACVPRGARPGLSWKQKRIIRGFSTMRDAGSLCSAELAWAAGLPWIKSSTGSVCRREPLVAFRQNVLQGPPAPSCRK